MGRDYKFKNYKDGMEKFSFSKLTTFEHCPYSYYLTYIKGIRGKDNIYGNAGTSAHECSQDIVMRKINNYTAVKRFKNEIEEAENILGLKFPTEKSGISYKECIYDFLSKYKPNYDKYEIEKGFDVLIGEENTLIWGFIDLIIHNKDGSLDVVDYKTSSEFTKKDFEVKRMQLLIYAKALIDEGFVINRLYFNMLKYCTVRWEENGKIKTTKTERNKIGNKLKIVSKRLLKKKGFDELDIECKVSEMIKTNLIDEDLIDEFEILDYEVDVELNNETLKEMEKWVDSIVSQINQRGKCEKKYNNIKINKSSEFYCKMLCGKPCHYLDTYLEKDSNSYVNRKRREKEEDDELDDLL